MGRAPRAALLALLLLAAPAASRAADVDLVGTWHVLMHYKDSASENPDVERWLDEVWVFERDGSRLKWARYPLVVFDDRSGRFERTSRQFSRTLHYWEPNEGQLAQIRSGLEINPRGSKSKSLRGSDRDGWRSAGASGGFSANTLTYTETWSVESPTGLPVFRMEDSLGGARAESLDGLTVYETQTVEPGGDVLRGTYNRDGTRVGTFRMMRSGAVSEVKGSASQAEMRWKAASATTGPLAAEGLAEMLKDPDVDPAQVRSVLMGRVLEVGGDPRVVSKEIQGLVDAIFAERARGTSPEEIERKVREGAIQP